MCVCVFGSRSGVRAGVMLGFCSCTGEKHDCESDTDTLTEVKMAAAPPQRHLLALGDMCVCSEVIGAFFFFFLNLAPVP